MRSSDLGFRLGIGAFAAALLLIVIAIGADRWRTTRGCRSRNSD